MTIINKKKAEDYFRERMGIGFFSSHRASNDTIVLDAGVFMAGVQQNGDEMYLLIEAEEIHKPSGVYPRHGANFTTTYGSVLINEKMTWEDFTEIFPLRGSALGEVNVQKFTKSPKKLLVSTVVSVFREQYLSNRIS